MSREESYHVRAGPPDSGTIAAGSMPALRVSRVTPFLADLGGGKTLCFVRVIVNPDVCNCGGILELRAIAQMAEPSLVTVSPHNYNSTTVGLAATVQVSAAIPNFLITECFVNFEARGREVAVAPALEVRDGFIAVPTRPGLGVELDEAALRRFPARTLARAMPDPGQEEP